MCRVVFGPSENVSKRLKKWHIFVMSCFLQKTEGRTLPTLNHVLSAQRRCVVDVIFLLDICNNMLEMAAHLVQDVAKNRRFAETKQL